MTRKLYRAAGACFSESISSQEEESCQSGEKSIAKPSKIEVAPIGAFFVSFNGNILTPRVLVNVVWVCRYKLYVRKKTYVAAEFLPQEIE